MANDEVRYTRGDFEYNLRRAIAEDGVPSPPSLKDMLNAGMPEWLALATYTEIRRRLASCDPAVERVLGHEWRDFVVCYADIGDQLRTPS